MTDFELLGRAISIAASAHENQKDKSGLPYILHPLTVMNNVERVRDKIVAVLHDVIEDTDLTFEDLTEFPSEILEALDAISRRPGESVKNYYRRIKKNKIAVRVKKEDLKHNMDLSRTVWSLTKEDRSRTLLYHEKYVELMTGPY